MKLNDAFTKRLINSMFEIYRKYFILLFFSFLITLTGFAQEKAVNVERSTDKILLEGNSYYIHVVKKGQTLYSISKAYNISQKTISKENPSVALGLRPGQALKIPVSPVNEKQRIPGETEDFIFHKVESGETIFRISKKYDVATETILDNNPDININDISVGTIIKVPKQKYQVQEERYEFQKQEFLFHKVERKETIYGLATKYDISQEELIKANDGLARGLKTGQYVRIPVIKELKEEPEETIVRDTEPLDTSDINCETVPDFSDRTIEVALFLPFYLEKNSERIYIDSSEVDEYGEKIYETVNREETWVYSRSTYFLDFILGTNMALDKLQNEGVSVDLFCFDTKADSSVVKDILSSNDLSRMGLIIGPVYQHNLSLVSSFARMYRIPIVSPLSSRGDLTDNNPYLFQIAPPVESELDELARYVSNFHNSNIVLIHPGDIQSHEEIITLKRKLFGYFAYRTFFNEVIFKEIVFNDEFVTNDSINGIEHSLSKRDENLVIIPSGQETFSSEILGRLYSLSETYSISVLGFPNWMKFRNTELKYYYELGVRIITPSYLDYDEIKVKEFLRKFRNKYHSEPDQFSYAWKGYDIAQYFIGGIARYGDNFIYCHKKLSPELLETKFDFTRTSPDGGFINDYFRMVEFTEDNKIIDSGSIKEKIAVH